MQLKDYQPHTTEAILPPSQLQRLIAEFSLTFAFLVSAMPRAALAIVMTSVPANAIARDYAKQQRHGNDRASWRVITARRPIRLMTAQVDSSIANLRRWKLGHATGGPEQVIALPAEPVVFPGYPAVLFAGRAEHEGEFSDAEIARLQESLGEFAPPNAPPADEAPALVALDDSGVVRYSSGASTEALAPYAPQFATLTARLRGEDSSNAVQPRWLLKLRSGMCVPYRAVRYVDYPALGEGAITLLARAPSRSQWQNVSAQAVHADTEFARFLPAVEIMMRDFARKPSLRDLAAAVHLSPFHFHRSFSDATGTTPKHLMLDCQIESAKAELRAGKRTMSDIATACGFAHQSHFTSRFKQATGLTPTAWRRIAAESA